MKFNPINGWFHQSEFMRAATAIHAAATTDHMRWLGHSACKYVQLYVSQRTGDFVIRNREGGQVAHEELYAMFPELKDDTVPG